MTTTEQRPQRKRLAVWDLDGCVYSFDDALRRYIHMTTGRPLDTMPDADIWDFPTKRWGLSDVEFHTFFQNGVRDGIIFGTGSPMTDTAFSWRKLVSLRSEGLRIMVITHRGFAASPMHTHMARALTHTWLYNNALTFDHLSVATFSESKPGIAQMYARQHGIHPDDVWPMDDKADTVEHFVDAGFRNTTHIKAPWNKAHMTVGDWADRLAVEVRA